MPETVANLAKLVGGKLCGNGETEITGVAKLDTANNGELSFVEKPDMTVKTNASCVVVPVGFEAQLPCPSIEAENPKLAFAQIAAALHPSKKHKPEIHPTAIIAENASIGKGVFIGAFVTIGENSSVGDGTQIRAGAKIGDNVNVGENCTIHPNVFLEDGAVIGNNVMLHAGVVIGADGFGYVRGREGHLKFPQIGTIIIEDDVEIGANTCIDRGSLGETRIGKGTKIDNLCQIAHNVKIGKNVIIVAMTGISGSTEIGDDVIIAGQVGIADHVRIESGAVIGAKSAVFPGKIVRRGFWMGSPVQPINDYKQQQAMLRKLAKRKEK